MITYVWMYNNDIYTRSCDWRSEILLEIQLYLSSICLIKMKEQDMRAAAGAAKDITQPPCVTHTYTDIENKTTTTQTTQGGIL